ncbi:J517_1871 family lipoprotein [Acinetobacter gerneri]|jgi:hypothetical protein|uniref:J517_1871 family lipoprotein n=1 Tax=Acinetobacter gerneri TaxID=202952 RepID=UPI0023F1E4A4|nr:J517_1871 family lipoprotein [Acinetobacter gerneri]MCH4243761.1 hypothetical protein [Acinetobacter gerneri]
MRKILLSLGCLVSLSGCATTSNFYELTSSPTDKIGYWTGPHQNISVATLKLNSDGTGVICQDYNGVAKVVSVKKVENKIYTQDGSFWKIKNISENKLELAYGLGGSYFLNKDVNLTLVTPACLEKLK